MASNLTLSLGRNIPETTNSTEVSMPNNSSTKSDNSTEAEADPNNTSTMSDNSTEAEAAPNNSSTMSDNSTEATKHPEQSGASGQLVTGFLPLIFLISFINVF